MNVEPTLFESLFFKSEEKYIPISAFLEITRLCNLNCLHCYHEENRNFEMDFELVKISLKKMAEAGTLFLVISGGEPLLHRNFKEILECATELGFSISIFTNATLIDDNIMEIILNSTVTEINVSLYSMDEKIHNSITGNRESFRKTITALEKLSKVYIQTSVKMPILLQNYDSVRDVLEYSEKMGFKFKPDPLITPKNSGDISPLRYSPNDEQLMEAIRKFPQQRGEVRDMETKLCNAGKNYYAIDALGEIFPCIQMPYSIGNIKKDSLKEIWKNSLFLKKLREVKIEDLTICSNCCYNFYCDRCPGLVYLESKTLVGKSESNCRIARLRKIIDEN